MKKNTVEAYRIAIKAQYEKAKEGPNSSFLIKPSPGQLRDLSFHILKHNHNKDDYAAFRDFWDFEFNTKEIRAISAKMELSKLVPIRRFYLGTSTPMDMITIEMAALLVELPERPYKRFKDSELPVSPPIAPETPTKHDRDTDIVFQSDKKTQTKDSRDDKNTFSILNDYEKKEENKKDDLSDIDPENPTPDNTRKEKIEEPSGETNPPSGQNNEGENRPQDTIPIGITQLPSSRIRPFPILSTIVRFFKKRQLSKIHYGLATVMIMVLVVWSLNKTIFTPKNCMVWMEDHYEKMDCNDPEINGEIQPLDEQLLEHFRKVAYSDTLTCFDLYGNPLIWYSKTNGYYELFTHHGLHPVTGKTLKPITETIRNNLNSDPNQ
ncbi:hypothetical protein [Flavobacterium sp. WV_118_3]|uniref:hypothetical protein n=1 Tax=Flavobacterium sp. WV_118_3 TaxID=3151764 RepID=UPI003219CF71